MIVTPIKIQGKKTKLIPEIMETAQNLLESHPEIDTWVEPFLGSGVVAFNLAGLSRIRNVVVNDINPHIIKFYSEINEGKITGDIIRDVFEEHSVNLMKDGDDYYKMIRDRFNRDKNPLDFLFLTRTGFNGVMRFNKKGEWNIPFCKLNNRLSENVIEELTSSVESLSNLFRTKNFVFRNESFESVIESSPANSIFYCDPPYYGLDVKYYKGWEKKDEEKLNELIRDRVFIYSTWLDNGHKENPMIKELWNKFEILEKEHKYLIAEKASDRSRVVEGIIYPSNENTNTSLW